MTFGEQLRCLREAAGLSQGTLAERAGLSANAVGALERGERQHPYPHTVRQLAAALGLTEEQRAALAAAASRRGASPVDSPPAPAPDVPSTELPGSLTALVGREAETAVVRQLLARPGVRLLTLTGPGGVGKTRLAVRVAEESRAAFPGGIIFVSLAALRDPALVPHTIARALGLGDGDPGPLAQRAGALLGERPLLLLLDNFEQLAAAALVATGLLLRCPGLTVLVTSRAALRLRGEHEYRVPPLDLPGSGGDEVGAALESGAVRLFVARAREGWAEFALTPANAGAVAAICRRLDGLPLALELAAARIGLLSPAALLARLDRALPLLSGGPRDLPARQRTMRDAIAWSYDLLPPGERATFARLAVFAGGGTLPALEAVSADEAAEEGAVVDRIAALLHNNLLAREAAPGGNEGDGEPRLRMLEPIREYATERLAASEDEEAARRRHAGYYLRLAEEGRADQPAWLRRIEPERDNLRAALGWALAPEGDAARATLGLRLAVALWWFWEVRGHLIEGRAWLERALSAAGDAPPHWRAEALFGIGSLAIRQRDYAAADAAYAESLAVWRALGQPAGIARALTTLGEVALRRGEHARARDLLAESLALKRTLDDRSGIAESLNIAALVARDAGGYDEARVLLEESLALMRDLDRPWGIVVALSNLGHLALRQGDGARAAALLGQGLVLARDLGAAWSIAHCLEGLAGVAADRGDAAHAARLWGAAEALRETIGAPLPANLAPHHAGLVAATRAGADETIWAAAWAAGRALPLEEAIAVALP